MPATKTNESALRAFAGLGAILMFAAALRIGLSTVHPAAPVLTGCLAAAALGFLQASFTGRIQSIRDLVMDAAAIALLAAMYSPFIAVWQIPGPWSDVFKLSAPGAVISIAIYILAAIATMRNGRHLARHQALAIVLIPILFNLLILLAADWLLSQLGEAVSLHLLHGRYAATLGRGLVLLAFIEVFFGLLIYSATGRLSRDLRLHGLLAFCAIHAVLTVHFADLPLLTAHMFWPVQAVAAIAAAALAQSGLWAFVYVATGTAIEAVAGRPPTEGAARGHWRKGFRKGGVFGAIFAIMALIWGLLLMIAPHVPSDLFLRGVIAVLAGAATFPFFATLVGSADETPPFIGRLKGSYRAPTNFLRGAICGLGIFLAFACDLPHRDGFTRFVVAFVIGALAYGGADFIAHAVAIRRGTRDKMESWRIYAIGVLLGGIIGGALGWYFDQPQLDVVTAKLRAYADLAYTSDGRQVTDYVIYPLFSKWGMINLGAIDGGMKLFFTESLSGVINWSLAAPVFGVNYFILAALIDRSLRPLRLLLSREGLDGLVVQTVRVLRWGLWMAPVIFTFLKAAPDPAWYNQDGAVRTIVATFNSLTMPAHDFRMWSLVVFTGLLAYDWLRVLIWFDHMGLRVATLVNLTFLGGDKADEAAARFAGHAAPTRFMPDAIRRFATWMPLLIPFYIPRGAEWDTAWTGAERLHNQPMPHEIASLIINYTIAGLCGIAICLVISRYWTRMRSAPSVTSAAPEALAHGPTRFGLSNGGIGVELLADGRGYRHIYDSARPGVPIDLTPRPVDVLQPRGLFFYVNDRDSQSLFSLGYEPCHIAAPDYAVTAKPGLLTISNSCNGIQAEAEIRLAEADCVELWSVRLTNLGTAPRRLSLTSYQEIAIAEFPAYARDRDFFALHVATWFMNPLNAIFARNRLLRDGAWTQAEKRMSREIFFHAAKLPEQGATLLGYEDSRTRFIGQGQLRRPSGVEDGRPRGLDDEGLLYTFDAAASLSVGVDLAANASCEIIFVTGHAADERIGARLAARYTGRPVMDDAAFFALFNKIRSLKSDVPAAGWPYAFSNEGNVLRLTQSTPRPWAHVLSNPLGYGAIVSNDGEIHSFAGNERQNALTPYTFESVPSMTPGQILYVVDIDTDEIFCPGYVPQRRADTDYEIVYEKGVVTFRNRAPSLDLELTLFVPPDKPADVRLLKIRNTSKAARRLRIVPYFDLALGESPSESSGRIDTSFDKKTGTMLFTNRANSFYQGMGFAATGLQMARRAQIRAQFIGAAGHDLTRPTMVLTGKPDPKMADDGRRIAACSGRIDIAAGGEAEVAIVFGQAADKTEAISIAQNLRQPAAARQALAATRDYWASHGPVIEIESNHKHFDRLVNHWLHYEAVACRLYARGGPNQRSGAFGFRDQLQDVLPLFFSDPAFARRQILLHASQQFIEGDVLKWWHATQDGRTGLGQRSRASDPHLWLPYVVARYIAATGDDAILTERTPYLTGPKVPMSADSWAFVPRLSQEDGDLYEHCRLAIDHALDRFGSHGLPLFGTGDWNDGIDHLGFHGRGESVWMSFFLHGILHDFAPIIAAREGETVARHYLDRADALKAAIEQTWAGDHYIVGYSDDGVVLDRYGSMNAAWPALTGAVSPERGRAALEGALAHIEKADRILLFDQSFDEFSTPYPGRIADYPPGLRENGGQYSHGASWSVDAYVRLAEHAAADGDTGRAALYRARAFELWKKISPMDKMEGEALAVYGLVPHQQAADISEGLGHAGRGGWSWYTGAAARMLSAAYLIMGIKLVGGEIIVPDDIYEPKGKLMIKNIKVRGKTFTPSASADSRAKAH